MYIYSEKENLGIQKRIKGIEEEQATKNFTVDDRIGNFLFRIEDDETVAPKKYLNFACDCNN